MDWKDPKLGNLKVMGCKAYAHSIGGKLDPLSTRCVFIGYQYGIKRYRLRDRESGGVKVIVSRDVIFNELVFPCKETNHDASMGMTSATAFIYYRRALIVVEHNASDKEPLDDDPNT